jgi:hypothetical protein
MTTPAADFVSIAETDPSLVGTAPHYPADPTVPLAAPPAPAGLDALLVGRRLDRRRPGRDRRLIGTRSTGRTGQGRAAKEQAQAQRQRYQQKSLENLSHSSASFIRLIPNQGQ